MKIIYVTPHLSTGGMPEYLRRKVELMKDDHDVWVVEKHFEMAYRTIRDKIEEMIGDRLVTLRGNNRRLLDLIRSVSPDVVHFEELSDYHFEERLLDEVYTEDRKYRIIETLHDSSIDHLEKRYMPDKMLVVSPWQVHNFMPLGIPIEMLEHEITPGERDRSLLSELGLDPDRKHVVQVGIFSSRKNQAETVSMARSMPDVEFHFVGTLAENYKPYWEPILQTLPPNCRVWGERSDVHRFYSCVDAVVFPSRGDYGDRETNPLVIREAIEWGVPLLVRNHSYYMGMYSEGPKVSFMSDDTPTNCNSLRRLLGKQEIKMNVKTTIKMQDDPFKKKLFDISFNPDDNKINFEYLGDVPLDTMVCVRDLDTEVPIYSFDAAFAQGTSVWCVPIPKPYYDFHANPNFGGFMYDFYVNGERKYTQTTRIKSASVAKERFRIESFEPIFVNYEQFFTDRIYDEFIMNARRNHPTQEMPGSVGSVGSVGAVVDIGANIGLFTELALRNGADRVISLEINERAIGIFENIHAGKDNVTLVKKAAYDKTGEITIYSDPNNSLVGSVFPDHTNGLVDSYTVVSVSVEELLREQSIDRVGIMKIDVEGSEYAIFDGMSDETLSRIENLILEFHDNFGGRLRDSIIKRLEGRFDYKIYQDDCKNTASEWEERGTIFAKRKMV